MNSIVHQSIFVNQYRVCPTLLATTTSKCMHMFLMGLMMLLCVNQFQSSCRYWWRCCKVSPVAITILLWPKSLTAIFQHQQTVPPPQRLLEGKVCNLLIDCTYCPCVTDIFMVWWAWPHPCSFIFRTWVVLNTNDVTDVWAWEYIHVSVRNTGLADVFQSTLDYIIGLVWHYCRHSLLSVFVFAIYGWKDLPEGNMF